MLQIVAGLVYGGTMRGIDAVLLSQYVYGDSGQLLTASFMDHLLSSALEVPHITLEDICTPAPGHPLGAKGAVRKTLLDFVREDLLLTGTHAGCEHGVCGCCNVLLDGELVRSCMLFAVQADGHEVTTIEGIGTACQMHPVQHAFAEHHGRQCGYCTPGMILAAVALLQANLQPTEQEIRTAIAGNLCRCTGYMQIVAAIQAAATRMGGALKANRGYSLACCSNASSVGSR
ncbi:MAG TPA: 2Fe-2S iron-sulfur cluster-binding protein [Candidatus Tectomicrobia bacterium]|jgi:carbon-monoxide dehydrogenase small subunit